MRVGIVLLSVGVRSAERRVATLFRHLAQSSQHSYYLVGPLRLLRQLKEQGILDDERLEVHSMGPDPGGEHLERLHRTDYVGFLAWRRLLAQALARANAIAPTDVIHYATPVSYFMGPPEYRRKAVVEAVSSTQEWHDGAMADWHVELSLRAAAKRGAVVSCLAVPVQRALARGMAPDVVRRMRVSPGSILMLHDVPAGPKLRQVAFLGRLQKVKNPLLFVDAMAALAKRRNGDFKAVMVGEGPLEAAVDSRIRDAGLAGLLTRLPGTDAARRSVLRESLVYVTLQSADNYPSQSLLEAMASRCAIVASDVGTTHQLVTPDTGLLVPLSPTSVAEAVSSLLDDEARAQTMGRAAREIVERDHQVAPYAAYVEGLYRGLA